MGRIQERDKSKKLIAVLTNHCDDIYCFRRELLEGLKSAGYQILISCPDGDKFSLIDECIDYIYDDMVLKTIDLLVKGKYSLAINHYEKIYRQLKEQFEE